MNGCSSYPVSDGARRPRTGARRQPRRRDRTRGRADDAGARDAEPRPHPRAPARVAQLRRRARRRRRHGAVRGLAPAPHPPSPRTRDRRAPRPLRHLRPARLARRRPARPGGLPHRAPPARLPRARPGGLLSHHAQHAHDHAYDHHGRARPGAHDHSHALVDRSIARSRAGVKTVATSLAILGFTAAVQLALLADLIHNFGDALTAVPLGIAFFFRSFRGEKLAGLAVVLAIFVSASVALYETILRFIHPQELTHLWVLAAAGAIGFLGNELAAQVRLNGGGRLASPA